ncbi:VWA domain-containing protein [Pseudonocardia sp. CA-107938]|uniref:VWA domain-containing protein n=1 Tax=Pseudonocardia sp. CA-107938 TaxID=3240021 RepID=UPI003D8D476A
MSTPAFPFSAVVGHADLRLALLLNAVHPGIGGVLVRGEKGTAKSTVVRALAALLPQQLVADGCRFRCDATAPDPSCPDGPHRTDADERSASAEARARHAEELAEHRRLVEMTGEELLAEARRRHPDASEFRIELAARVLAERAAAGPPPVPVTPLRRAVPFRLERAPLVELPVGATEDRLVGSLDLEKVLQEGTSAFRPGLLAQAHRGVLYVDEVNLLPDHLVDSLLDAAAMGRVHVERDGVSVTHAARFLLVGTMNPEEGELRPQLLDRFGLAVEVRAARDVDTRVEVVRRRMAFEADPAGFVAQWADAERDIAESIEAAQQKLPAVELPDTELRRIASVCAAFEVDGMRADLVIAHAARAHAALRGAARVDEEDVRVAARLALPHRRRRDPFDEPGIDEQALEDALDQAGPPDEPPEPPEGGGAPPPDRSDPSEGAERPSGDGATRPAPPPGQPFRARLLRVPGLGEGAPGKRSRARTDSGRVVRATGSAPQRPGDLHLPATVVAAAGRGRTDDRLQLTAADLRGAVREGREGNLVLFAVDASGSMAARRRMSAVTGAVLSLLRDAYQRRDKVGMVTFRAGGAEVALPPTSSVPAAQARLAHLSTGGRTPLADGLLRARKVLQVERLRDPRRRPLLVVLTDGRATVAARPGSDPVRDACRAAALLAADGVATVVVDCEAGPVRLGLAAQLAEAAQGALVGIGELSADRVAGIVQAVWAA